jgi:hypothetical protein
MNEEDRSLLGFLQRKTLFVSGSPSRKRSRSKSNKHKDSPRSSYAESTAIHKKTPQQKPTELTPNWSKGTPYTQPQLQFQYDRKLPADVPLNYEE